MQHPADNRTGGSDVTTSSVQDKAYVHYLDQSHGDSSGVLTGEGLAQISFKL